VLLAASGTEWIGDWFGAIAVRASWFGWLGQKFGPKILLAGKSKSKTNHPSCKLQSATNKLEKR